MVEIFECRAHGPPMGPTWSLRPVTPWTHWFHRVGHSSRSIGDHFADFRVEVSEKSAMTSLQVKLLSFVDNNSQKPELEL